MLLAGDIGGTKTILTLMDTEKEVRHPLAEQRFASDEYESLEAIVQQFLTDTAVTVDIATFGVAGPVVNNRAQITNLPWMIDAAAIAQTFNIAHVYLLNDLEAIANAVTHLEPGDLTTLNVGQPAEHGAIAVIAPGTGLGEAFLTWTGTHYQAHPSEGGHTAFGPGNAEQIDLLHFLHGRYRHVSYERVCSGIGIPNLYDFLKWDGRHQEPDWLARAIAAAEDPTPVIVNAAIQDNVPLCIAVLNLFVDILGDEAGNLALKTLATGGVYIGGGIPPRILPQLQQPRFLQAFRRKGRFADLMAAMPIHVIEHPQAALLGAAHFGMEAASN
ncbi:MAG: glucokinase [Ardenticatenaceae bacterium]|nr:glucokinase [Ardenticatenaceae bacterium]MCB9445144.1 glucokinase [Ardenticatenaceae bacterium]